jgi:hypothetical protein
MQTLDSFETSLATHPATERHIPENTNPQLQSHDNLNRIPTTHLTECNSGTSLQLPTWWCYYDRAWAGIARCSDSLRAGRSGYRIPVEARFSAPVQTGPGAHPPSYTMGTGYLPGVKEPGRGVDPPPPSSTEVEGRVKLHICSLSGPSWPVLV